MALKPFWNKKYHLGMAGDEVKAGIKAGAAIPKIEDGDVGKAVVVNEAGTGFELAEVGGGKLYIHKIISVDANFPDSVIIITTDNTPFTKATLTQYLKDKEFSNVTPLTGTMKIRKDGTKVLLTSGIYYVKQGSTDVLRANQPYIDLSDSSVGELNPTITQTITDSVVEL